MMEVLVILGFLLLVVTLVGHGIWVFVAHVVHGLSEPDQPSRPIAPAAPPKRECLHCGALCAATFQNCPTCGKPVAEQPRSPVAKLESLQRQLDLLLAEHVLTLEQFTSARTILRQAENKFRPPKPDTPPVEDLSKLPVLEAAEPDVEQVFGLPVLDRIPRPVENLPHKRSTWTDWLQAFLEEKNIRWGELLAGLLIVGSSVGLVISLWSTLRNAIPYFPALCFLAVTAAIHGAGLYTLKHWRLKTTSRGLLTIALLLVPLNFLAAIALSEQRSATDPLYLTAVGIGVAAYGWITWTGSRELMHFRALWLSLAVLGSAIGQLFIGRCTTPGMSTLDLSGLFALPLLTYAAALFGMSEFASQWKQLTPRRIESLYRLLGIAFFSLCVALGLLLWKSQAVHDTLSRLSPCVSFAAAIVVGFVGHVFNVPRKHGHVENVPHDIAATAVALVGATLMVVAVVLAWPDPERLIAVGIVNFVALSWFGFATRLAPLHFPALTSLALAGLIAFHRYGEAIGGAGIGEDRSLIATLLLGRSGVVVALMSLLTTFVARYLPTNKTGERGGASMVYLAAAAGMAVLSLGIAGYAGFWPQLSQPSIDRSLPTVVFVLFGIAGMLANERLNRIEVAWAGAAVWLAAFMHALGWNTHLRDWLTSVDLLPSRPIVVALLSFATWSLGCAIVGNIRNRFVAPWSAASGRAIVVALFALPWKVWGDFGPHALYLGWIATLCLGQAHLWQSRNLFSLSQAVAFIAASLGVTGFAQHQEWWLAHAGNDVAAFWDVRHWHWQLAGLATASAPWILWRRFGGRFAVLARCCDWKLDRIVQPVVVIAATATVWFSLWPLLGFERYQRPDLWPVVMQGWIARGWDRTLLWLIGWGAVTWSLEEVCRRWFLRSRSLASSSSRPIRFPWVSALATLAVGLVLFLIPQIAWSGVPIARRLSSVDPRVLFGWSMWWVAGAGLLASGSAFLERGRGQVRVFVVACWVTLWQVESVELTSAALERRSWSGAYLSWFGWLDEMVFNSLTLIGLGFAVGGGIVDWLVRRFVPEVSQRQRIPIRNEVWGVVGCLCLLPVIGLAPQVSIGGANPGATSVIFCWALLLVWRAWRTRSSAVAFGASHAWCWVFAATALMSPVEDLVRNYLPAAETVFVRFLLCSTVALGTFSWLWVRWRRRWRPMEPAWWDWRGDPATVTPWLWQQHWSWGCLLLSSVFATWEILRRASLRQVFLSPFDDYVGHVAFALVAYSTCLAARRWRHRWHTLGLASLAWVPVLAAGYGNMAPTSWFDTAWKPYHIWEVGWLVLAIMWSAGRCLAEVSAARKSSAADSLTQVVSKREQQRNAALSLWSDVTTVGVLLLAVREFVAHQSVVWPASCVAVVFISGSILAWLYRSQWRVASAISCAVLATAMAWTRDWDGLQARTEQQVFWWLEASITALALAACVWQMVEVWWQARRGRRFDGSSRFVTAGISSRIALDAALAVVLLVVLSQMLRPGVSIHELGGWLMVLAVTLPFVVSWWDRFAKLTVDGIYGSVWLILLMILDASGLDFGDSWVALLTGLIAVDVALVGAAWWFAKGSSRADANEPLGQAQWGDEAGGFVALHVSWRERLSRADRWLPNAELVWSLLASALVLFGVLTFEDRALRFWNVASAALLVAGVACTAQSLKITRSVSEGLMSPEPRLRVGLVTTQRERLQRVALGLGAVWAVEFLWAWMEPQPRFDFWLQRSIRALEALSVTAFVYSVGLVRVIRSDSDWREATVRAARDLVCASIVTLLIVLGLEARWFDPINGAPVTGLQIAFVATALVGLAAALLAIALSDRESLTRIVSEGERSEGLSIVGVLERSPSLTLRVNEGGFFSPQACVYAAEAVMALLFLHVYLTMPELFRGYFRPYWPLIVMAIAFAGVGASELCQRANLPVLSGPLQNSAALLPLIPALGFWVATSRADYSTVLFAAGLVYVGLNMRRRSFWYVLGASLAGNAGLWALWSEQGVELLVRPQVWLIPPSVSVLAAAQWNRERLSDAQLAAIRYPAIMLLYVSSAGEMFLTGIAESFWLPIVLMVLSVLGVLAGIWLRVRAFLYLGVSFLLLSLVSMVWHAAEAIDHTWPWWAFGIGLGLGVLTLFGLFERKRNEMLRLLGELRTWER